jgi:hypothetical protein
MPRTKKGTPPSYRLHSSGQAVVTVRTTSGNLRDILLGPWDTNESKTEYARVLGVLSANGGRYPEATTQNVSPSVNEIILSFWEHAKTHYGDGNKELE